MLQLCPVESCPDLLSLPFRVNKAGKERSSIHSDIDPASHMTERQSFYVSGQMQGHGQIDVIDVDDNTMA